MFVAKGDEGGSFSISMKLKNPLTGSISCLEVIPVSRDPDSISLELPPRRDWEVEDGVPLQKQIPDTFASGISTRLWKFWVSFL